MWEQDVPTTDWDYKSQPQKGCGAGRWVMDS